MAGSRPPASAAARRRCRIASAARLASPAEPLHVDLGRRPLARPRDDELPHDLFLDDHGETDLAPAGGRPAVRGDGGLGSRPGDDPRDPGARIVPGHVREVRPGQLQGRGGDPPERRPDVAGRAEGACRRRQPVDLSPGSREGLGIRIG